MQWPAACPSAPLMLQESSAPVMLQDFMLRAIQMCKRCHLRPAPQHSHVLHAWAGVQSAHISQEAPPAAAERKISRLNFAGLLPACSVQDAVEAAR